MMWKRPYIRRLPRSGLHWSPLGRFPVAGRPAGEFGILSEDAEDGACTGLWRVPPGWRHEGGFRMAGDEQLFILEGEFRKGGWTYRRGCFGYRPAGTVHEPMGSDSGALLLVMWDADRGLPARAGRPGGDGDGKRYVDTGAMVAIPTPVDGPPPGIGVRILNRHASTGGMTMLISIPAGWSEPRMEHHDCVEESFKLSGRIVLDEDGEVHELVAGDYFYRPPRIKHGRMRTDTGTTSLIRFSAEPENHYGPL